MSDHPAPDARPIVVVQPAPRRIKSIFTDTAYRRLNDSFEVINLENEPDSAIDAYLPDAFAIVGQPTLSRDRLDRAPRLRALLNVEGNFLPNVDYPACFDRGIHVLGCGPAFAQAVAEYALGLALDLARGISREDRAFRNGAERYVEESTHDSILLRGADIAFIGYGNLGRALHRLLRPFDATIRVYDPWLPDSVLSDRHLIPTPLADLLRRSTIVFVLATVTSDSEQLLGAKELALLPRGARLILVSRAAVVDFAALRSGVRAGRFLAAIDVWPSEPVAADDPARDVDGLVLSAHRPAAFPRPSSRSVTWWSTICSRSSAATLQRGCRPPRVNW